MLSLPLVVQRLHLQLPAEQFQRSWHGGPWQPTITNSAELRQVLAQVDAEVVHVLAAATRWVLNSASC